MVICESKTVTAGLDKCILFPDASLTCSIAPPFIFLYFFFINGCHFRLMWSLFIHSFLENFALHLPLTVLDSRCDSVSKVPLSFFWNWKLFKIHTLYCSYDKDHIIALRMNNTSDSLKQLRIKHRKVLLFIIYTSCNSLLIAGINWTRIWPASRGFITPLTERRTDIAEVMGLKPVGASDFFLGFIYNYVSYFIKSSRITFTCILYRQCTHMILHIVVLFI